MLRFDHLFLTETGRLQVLLNGILLDTVLPIDSFGEAEPLQRSVLVTEQALADLMDVPLVFRLFPGSEASVLLDKISLSPAMAVPLLIDIKPGSDPNAINPRSKGFISVAILTTEGFDAQSVDPSTIAFGPDGAEIGLLLTHFPRVGDRLELPPKNIQRNYRRNESLVPVYARPETLATGELALRLGSMIKLPYGWSTGETFVPSDQSHKTVPESTVRPPDGGPVDATREARRSDIDAHNERSGRWRSPAMEAPAT